MPRNKIEQQPSPDEHDGAEKDFEKIKREALASPLPPGELFKAAIKQTEIEDAEAQGAEEAEIGKLHGELLKIYTDNYDRIVGPNDPKKKEREARDERLKVAEIEDIIREHKRVFPEYRNKSSYVAEEEYLNSDEFKVAADKRKALKEWQEKYWNTAGNKEKDDQEHAEINARAAEQSRIRSEQRKAEEEEKEKEELVWLGEVFYGKKRIIGEF